MSQERLMRDLGELAREESSGDAALPTELTRPFDGAELDAILIGAEETVRAGSQAALPHVAPIREARRGWTRAAVAIGPLLAAAAMVLFLARPKAKVETAPLYEMIVEGGEQSARGPASPQTSGAVLRVARDGRFTLVLRPRAPVREEMRARVMIDHEGALAPWDAGVRISTEGAIRVDGLSALASLPSGPSRILVLVGDVAHFPANDDDTRRAASGTIPGVQVFVQSIDVAP